MRVVVHADGTRLEYLNVDQIEETEDHIILVNNNDYSDIEILVDGWKIGETKRIDIERRCLLIADDILLDGLGRRVDEGKDTD